MGSLQCVTNLESDVKNLRQWKGLKHGSRGAATQSVALQQFHDNEGLPFMLFNLVDGTDIGMVQRRRSLSLSFKPLEGKRIAGKILRQKLNRHAAPQLKVLCLVHHPHATAADDFEHSIMRDLFAYEAGRKPGRRHGSWLV